MLIDSATILVRSGKGGDGFVAFRREKYIPKGGPSGGDGGNGGHVYMRADPSVDTLLDFAGRHHCHAADGEPGAIKQCHGRNGKDLVIRVPPGTMIYDDDTGDLVIDLAQPDQQALIAPGGRGGFGNEHFKSPTNQTPRTASPGEPAAERRLRLELKLIADVGLVGKPNAGKSTLLSVVTRARPKIADYPFTTLEPSLGITELTAGPHATRRLVLADIPGLIEGASQGHGLGIQFLRHIERTRVLVHLLDADPTASGGDGDPATNYRVINEELAGYSPALAAKPQLVALSKIDLLPPERRAPAAAELAAELGCPVYPISAATKQGLGELLDACWQIVQQAKRDEVTEPSAQAGP